MATLILTAVGTALGGPLGGAIGALIGQQVDTAIVGGRKVEGPRLKELSVQTSSYGSSLPLHFGRTRAAGSVIWATELVEHKEKSGGGKGRPSVTSYSYTASFAVAVASRPISGIGRVWADGNLLRGESGDLKVGGTMRIHTGHGDQAADPLLSQAEGTAMNPAYRNTAYVVFEDLELADYGNRLPSLTFEIIADDEPTSVAKIIASLLPDADVQDLASETLPGFSIDQGTASDVLSVLSDLSPLSCAVREETVTFRNADEVGSTSLPLLPLPTAGGENADDAKIEGWSRKRQALPTARQCVVRYYDTARDYQPGLQRSIGRNSPGDVRSIELPAALSATQARSIAERSARRLTRPGDTMRYRITEVDRTFEPGAFVKAQTGDEVWRIDEWEWQADGLMLGLSAVPARTLSASAADPGRSNQPADLLAVPTRITAFEIPWDGSESSTAAIVRVAATAATSAWSGAALYCRQLDETLQSLGSTGRQRAIAGVSVTALAGASPLLLDTTGTVEVELASADFVLGNATWAQLMQGANTALLGGEFVQFARAERVAWATWRLGGLLRGRGGTEHAVATHVVGEAFVLIDENLVAPDLSGIDTATAEIIAIGRGDNEAASSAILNAGLTLRPLMPVHGKATRTSDGGIELQWVRRARGAWTWRDEVDVPLDEGSEQWEVAFSQGTSALRVWLTDESTLLIDAAMADELALAPDGTFLVRQVGRAAMSLRLAIPFPA